MRRICKEFVVDNTNSTYNGYKFKCKYPVEMARSMGNFVETDSYKLVGKVWEFDLHDTIIIKHKTNGSIVLKQLNTPINHQLALEL